MTTIRNIIPYAPNEKSTVGIDAERLRASIAKLTSSSTNELEKLIAKLEALKARRTNRKQKRCYNSGQKPREKHRAIDSAHGVFD
jgi:hypothetical protein